MRARDAVAAQRERTDETELARRRAEALLLANGSELGLLAASQRYRQVWARDSILSGLGAMLCSDGEAARTFGRSLDTLRAHQSPLGKIPHTVERLPPPDPAEAARLAERGERPGVTLDTAHAGCVDSNLWYLLGHYYHHRMSGDLEVLRAAWPSLEAALLWLRYQDSNECGLLEVHEAMDWADLFANRYNVLFDNVLYYAGWRAMGALAEALGRDGEPFAATALDVRRKIDTLLWVGPEAPKDWQRITVERKEWLYPLRRIEVELVERPYYLPYVAFRDYADRFDTLGNLLAVLFGVADPVQAGKILDYIRDCGLAHPYPIRSLYPVIREGERDWRDYYRLRNLNAPDHYHNGGIWPFIGGLYVAALVQAGRHEQAAGELARLAALNRAGRHEEWEFNEWCHGLTGMPMGTPGQSWSAAMYVFAHHAVRHGSVPGFDAAGGWTR
jgi:glycogen debranching enzyme